jgi:hypothetical protein
MSRRIEERPWFWPLIVGGGMSAFALLAIFAPKVDKQDQRRIFFECLRSLPAGPQATKYNDWDEVVQACDSVSSRMAKSL